MPYKLEETDKGWFVVNSDTGERKSKKPLTKKRALAQMKALYYFTGAEAKKKEAADMETVTFQITAPADVLQRFAQFLKDELESAGEGEIEDATQEAEAPTPKAKEVSTAPTGIPAHGPGGLFSTPGLGGGKLVKARIGKKKQTRKEWGDAFAAAFKEAATHA